MLDHFSLRGPFGVSPDPRVFLETEQHREPVATLYYAIQQRRGGGGKTSDLIQLMKMLEGKVEIIYLPLPYFDGPTVL